MQYIIYVQSIYKTLMKITYIQYKTHTNIYKNAHRRKIKFERN